MNYISVPTWENNHWYTTDFKTRDDYKGFVLSSFKEPGKYEFDESSKIFNLEADKFREKKYYCSAPFKSRDYISYWDDQKEKCRNGVIVKNNDKQWYLTRDYYMWINFLPINDKEQKKFDFPQIRDAQYHLALYEVLSELHYLHSAILKKRQIASSYFHAAKMLNLLWFEETPILKIGASLKDYINDKGTWKFFTEYKSFLNEHTAWYRPMTPEKMLMWQQQIPYKNRGRESMRGLKGVLQGVTFEKDPTAGVGGPCSMFFYEEAGIAPTMDITTEFLFPAMRSGQMTTGLFVAAGSVGDLDQCEPLKDMILDPKANGIYAVETDLLDNKGNTAKCGLFIPEQWSMPPYIDDYGNSLVEEAIKAIDEERLEWKKDLSPEKYQYRISQHPKNIEEAFAYRSVSIFPLNLIASQTRRIEEKEYPYELLELFRNDKGDIEHKPSNKIPIKDFPISKKDVDKEGAFVVWEHPIKNSEFGTYYAGIDPVSEGKTTTSESLCSIYVYKNPVYVKRINENEVESFIEKDKIVACWCGRFDDINKTHEKLELIIEWYNAWALVENNISLFIQYMISKSKQYLLVPKNQILFLKDLGANSNVFQEYGWKNTGTIFRNHLLSYLIEYLKEEIDTITLPDGKVVKTVYGVERIPDIMAMVEMSQYREKLNVDRLVALASLIAFAKVQQANRGYRERVEELSNNKLKKSEKSVTLNKSMFKNLGSTRQRGSSKPIRSPFKNIR